MDIKADLKDKINAKNANTKTLVHRLEIMTEVINELTADVELKTTMMTVKDSQIDQLIERIKSIQKDKREFIKEKTKEQEGKGSSVPGSLDQCSSFDEFKKQQEHRMELERLEIQLSRKQEDADEVESRLKALLEVAFSRIDTLAAENSRLTMELDHERRRKSENTQRRRNTNKNDNGLDNTLDGNGLNKTNGNTNGNTVDNSNSLAPLLKSLPPRKKFGSGIPIEAVDDELDNMTRTSRDGTI